jgi:deazaflavin-dependent oxidoreductase (nitroreductase family)
LVTRGRNSGKYWLTPLYYGKDGERFVLIGSKAGAKVHPSWYKNLLVHPNVRIQVGDKRMDAVASVVRGDERTRLWQLMEKVFPIYARYRESAAPREIPVVVLTPK